MQLVLDDLAPLAAAPAMMIAASLIESRWGPRSAGMVFSFPTAAAVGLVLVNTDLGHDAGREMALRMSGYIPAQIAVVLLLAALMTRIGLVRALVVAVPAYAGVAWVTTTLSPVLAVAAGVIALVAGARALPVMGSAASGERCPRDNGAGVIALRASAALVMVTALLVVARHFGPAVGGAVGAFPGLTVTLCLFVAVRSGLPGVRHALTGLVHGLPAYLAFVLSFGLAASFVGLAGTLIVALAACGLTYVVLTRDYAALLAGRHTAPSRRGDPESDAADRYAASR